MNDHRYCVIMCGGIGSRFWPYSRTTMPKQFIDFLGVGRSLLQMARDRVLPVVPESNIIVVTNAAYASLVAEQLPGVPRENILCEPERRNTAPAIAWAAHHIHALDPDASMIVAPSDHVIMREQVFVDCVTRGFEFVESRDALLTLGIQPSRPETGYGYIQTGQPADGDDILKVKTFTEKPNAELARVFLDSGEFLWNAGIFLWSAKSILKALEECAPELARRFDAGQEVYGTPAEQEFIKHEFAACPGISIDYAVMEKAPNVYVERVDLGWSDLGTWSALYDLAPHNREGNVARDCHMLAYDTTGCIVVEGNPDKLVVVSGLKDYIIADTGDVLMIHPMSREQEIKQIVNDVETTLPPKFL